MKKPKTLVKSAFRKWLKSRRAQHKPLDPSGRDCPLAAYLGMPVGTYRYGGRFLPKWAQDFAESIDRSVNVPVCHHSWSEITPAMALECLK